MLEDLHRPRFAAEQLLNLITSEGRPTRGATPLDGLVARLNVDVLPFSPETQRPGVLGWLEPGESLIYLRTGLPEPLRRFTLAHELGHYVLHRSGGQAALNVATPHDFTLATEVETLGDCDDRDLNAPLEPVTATDETLRPGQAYSARARRESEANIFAALLLLPPAAVLDAYLEATRSGAAPRRRDRLRALADRFGVSEDVLLRQLAALLTSSRVSGVENDQAGASQTHGRGEELDSWQRAAAESGAPALVVAGPGTGKTSTLVARVAHLVSQRSIAPHQILALTFSNRAAREMRARLNTLLATYRADKTEQGSLPTVSTIHAFCGDLLRRYAPLAGLRPDFRLISETDGYFVLRELADTLRLSHFQPLSAPAMHFPALLAAISRAKDELCEPEEYAAAGAQMLAATQTSDEREAAERVVEVGEVYRAYQTVLEARGDADFGDMIRLAVRILRDHPDVLADVRARYQHVLVDEFQDINRAMGVLLRILAGESGPLWAVGDADQAIYRFRGASPANLRQFASEYPAAQVHTLRQNYRSQPAILEAAAALAGALLDGSDQPRTPLRSVRGGADTITLAVALDETSELAGLAEAIRTREAHGRPLSEQVVLCRTRRQCQRVAAALLAAGIKTELSLPMIEHAEIKDVLAVLSLLVESSGMGLLRAGHVSDHAFTVAEARALLGTARERQMSPLALLRSLPADISDLSHEGRVGLSALRAILADLQAAPDVATGLARYVFGLTEMGTRLLDVQSTGERRMAAGAMAQLLALAWAFEDRRQAQSGAYRPYARGRADWPGFLDYIRIVAALRQETGSGTDELKGDAPHGVRVLTVHASKGLEFPVVYLPGLADRRFPIQRRGSSMPLPAVIADVAPPEHAAVAHLAEEACLFYVAITRARDELVLSHADKYGRMRYRPSPFLMPIEARLGDRLIRERWSSGILAHAPDYETITPSEQILAPEPENAPVSIAAIEAYSRCPRQYAYRYLYRLRTREIGLATLRRALHETLDSLYAQVATVDARQGAALSLEEAQTLFQEKWMSALQRERSAATRDEEGPPGSAERQLDSIVTSSDDPGQPAFEPFLAIYQRHGNTVVERAWRQLTKTWADELRTHFDSGVTVRVGERDITVTLDRVEHRKHASGAGGRRGKAEGNEALVRIVRHRLGRAEAEHTDVRALLYELAAEQSANPTRPELQQQNLTTGETGPIRLDDRKLSRLRERLDELLAGMHSGIYPPKPDPMICPTCPYFLICPA